MRQLKLLVLPLLLLSALGACNKDEKNDNVVSRDDLPINAAQEGSSVISNGTGTLDVAYDKNTHMLTYDVTWSGLTSDSITGSHIHGTAPKGVSAGIMHPFDIPKTASGHYRETFLIDGVKIKEDSLLKGFYYVNIHTNRYKGGEIRGQIEF